jgi:hypothetical protein
LHFVLKKVITAHFSPEKSNQHLEQPLRHGVGKLWYAQTVASNRKPEGVSFPTLPLHRLEHLQPFEALRPKFGAI